MRFKIKSSLLVAATVLATAAFCAPAFSMEPMAEPMAKPMSEPMAAPMLSTGGYARQFQKMAMMKMIDADGDHKVTKAEYEDYYGKLFDKLDKDSDGSVDAKEWTGPSSKSKLDLTTGGYSRELRSMKMMGMMDKDGDHKVTKEEFLAFHDAVFAKMDATSTGEITAQQWGAKGLTGK